MALTDFTDVANVRREAGFTGSTNVTDTMVEPHVKSANAEVNMSVAARYTVPLTNNTGYAGSVSEDYLTQLAASLGAGLLLMVQYPDMQGDFESPAFQKIKYARDQLKLIQNGTLKLVGTDGNSFNQVDSSLQSASGLPSGSTSPGSQFTMSDKF